MCLTLGLKAEFKVNLRRIRVEFTLNSIGMSALQFILSSFLFPPLIYPLFASLLEGFLDKVDSIAIGEGDHFGSCWVVWTWDGLFGIVPHIHDSSEVFLYSSLFLMLIANSHGVVLATKVWLCRWADIGFVGLQFGHFVGEQRFLPFWAEPFYHAMSCILQGIVAVAHLQVAISWLPVQAIQFRFEHSCPISAFATSAL